MNRRDLLRKKVLSEQQEKEKNLLTNYELRIDSECRKKENTENLIEKIAAEEMELINRLKVSQKIQQEVKWDWFKNKHMHKYKRQSETDRSLLLKITVFVW